MKGRLNRGAHPESPSRKKMAGRAYALFRKLEVRGTAPLRAIQISTALGMSTSPGLPDVLSNGVLHGDFG